jgi:NAD(P)-dependent dehydrogenase (short-subunit alcohol dehydrogenase family)
MLMQDRVVVVTGASRGIGRAIALRCATEGARVVGAARNAAQLKALEAEIGEHGAECVTVTASVAAAEDVERIINTALGRFGRIDVLVNNAGINRTPEMEGKDILALTGEDWDDVMNVNLKGAFMCSQAAARQMIKQHDGRIINMASVLSMRVSPRAGLLYHVSKGGLVQLTAYMAAALAPYGIMVNAVAPGWVETDLTKDDLTNDMGMILSHNMVKYVAKPDDVADLIICVAIEKSKYLVGQTIVFDGGQTLLAATYDY